MEWETYNFTDDFQDMLLACLIRHPDKFFTLGRIIRPSFFNGPAAIEVVQNLQDYSKKYGKYPNFSMLANYAFQRAARTNPEHGKSMVEYCDRLSGLDTSDFEGVRDLAVSFARERAVVEGLKKIYSAQSDGTIHKMNPVSVMEQALSVGKDMSDMGLSLYHDYGKAIDTATSRTYGVKTGYAHLDAVWKFGWAPGWLIVPLAPPKRFKCLGKGTPILMFDGSVKPVEQIQVGDKLMGDDSTARTVTHCGSGQGPLYRVTQASGDDFICNDAHILCVKHADGRIQEITAEDYCKKNDWFKREWQGYKTGVEFPTSLVDLDPYVLGLWLGDGSTSKPEICVSDKDTEIHDYLCSYAASKDMRLTYEIGQGCRQVRFVATPKYNEKCAQVECNNPQTSGGYCHVHYCRAYSKGFRVTENGRHVNFVKEALVKLEVYDKKRIPSAYKINDRSCRLNVLAGLIDSDGYYSKNRGYVVTLTNKDLVSDTRWIARSLGFKAHITEVKTSIKSIDYVGVAWRVVISGEISQIPVKLPRKKAVDSYKGKQGRYKIKVTPIGDGEYWGFAIDGNNRFLLDDFTVTHNTGFCINLAMNMSTVGNADVLYYACEISQELAMMRAIYNMTGFTEQQIWDNPEKYKQRIGEKLKERMFGNVWFKSFPSKSVTIADIETHAKHVIQTHGLQPKAIFIDYAETVKPSETSKDAPDYRQQADVYIQARALGSKLGCCVVMPDRCNKETVDQKVPSMKSFQGSFEKAGAVDIAIGLCQTEQEHIQRRMRYFVFLNRHGEALRHFSGRVDPDLMRLTIENEIEYDPEAVEQDSRSGYSRGGQGRGKRNKKTDDDFEATQAD